MIIENACVSDVVIIKYAIFRGPRRHHDPSRLKMVVSIQECGAVQELKAECGRRKYIAREKTKARQMYVAVDKGIQRTSCGVHALHEPSRKTRPGIATSVGLARVLSLGIGWMHPPTNIVRRTSLRQGTARVEMSGCGEGVTRPGHLSLEANVENNNNMQLRHTSVSLQSWPKSGPSSEEQSNSEPTLV